MRLRKDLFKHSDIKTHYEGTEYVEVDLLHIGSGSALLIFILAVVILAACPIALVVHSTVVHITSKPPKVITKIVRQDTYTAAQKEFIKQCETNHRVPQNSTFDDYAIPNIEVTPWTCSFANG